MDNEVPLLEQSPIQNNFINDPTKDNAPTPNTSPSNADNRQKIVNIVSIITIIILLFQIFISIGSNINIRDTTAAWTEGRVFNYFTGYVDIAVLFITFLSNIIISVIQLRINHSSGKANNKLLLLLLLLWIMWTILGILAFLIKTYSEH